MADLNLSLIMRLVDKVSGPMAKTRKALSAVQEHAARADGFRKLKQATEDSARALASAQDRAQKLGRQLGANGTRTKAAARDFEKVRQEVRRAAAAHQQNTLALQRERVALAAVGVNTRNLTAEKRRLSIEAERLQRRLNGWGRFAGITNGIGGGLRSMAGGALSFARALPGIGTFIGVVGALGGAAALTRSLIGAAALTEKFSVQLESIEGSSEKARIAMSWVRDFATKTPLDLNEVMGSFVRLRAFGLDPMDGTMRALVDMNAKLGGSGETLEGIVLAVGQAWTKQKLQGEEALQLIERGVPVWDLLSKRTGKTTAELMKLSERGKLGRDAIRLLIEEMGKTSLGASEKQMKTWNGMVSNLGDHWTRFLDMVAEAGAFDALKARLNGLLTTLDTMAKNGELQRWARKFSDAIVTVIDVAGPVLRVLVATGRVIGAVFGAAVTVVKVLLSPLYLIYKLGQLIGTVLDYILKGIDKISGSGIRNWIGRGVAMFAAGLGDEAASEALTAEASRSPYGPDRPQLDGTGREVDVGGTLTVRIEQDGRARVQAMESAGPLAITAETGAVMAGF